MTTDPYDINDMSKWTAPAHLAEVDPEVEAAYYESPPLARCLTCWNLEPCCTCMKREQSWLLHPSQSSEELAEIQAEITQHIVAGIPPDARERLLHRYVERGVTELERIANGDG